MAFQNSLVIFDPFKQTIEFRVNCEEDVKVAYSILSDALITVQGDRHLFFYDVHRQQ